MTSVQAPTVLLLTGPPGSGKTTIIRRAVERLGARAGGFYTQELREVGTRTGFEIVTLDGQHATLARVGVRALHMVGRYGVDVEAVERVAVPALERAVASGSLVVVDEIGKMELFSPRFREAVLNALARGARVLGTVMLAPHPFADGVKRDPRVRLVTVTQSARDAALRDVLEWLGAPAGSGPDTRA